TTIPILIILNALTRFMGSVFGVLVQIVLMPNITVYARSIFSKQANLPMEIDQLLALVLTVLVLIPLAIWAGRLNIRYHFVERLQQLLIDGLDYTLVAIYFGVYFFALQVVLAQKLQLQADVTLLLGMILGVFYYYLILSRFEQLNNDKLIENLRGYDATVSHMNEEMHRFSHDYQNVLLSLSVFVKRSDDEELKQYFDQVVHDNQTRLQVLGNGDLERLRYVSGGYMKGLLYAKMLQAEQNNVQLQVKINEEILLRQERSVDLVRIFGNVLDNALEAAMISNHIVVLSAAPTEDHNVFQVINKIPAQDKLDLSKVSKEGVTTKNGHLGIGMANIRRLAKQDIEVDQVIADQRFTTTIKIPKAG
ncbi:MAG TPA: hypothetical protein DCW31_11220, partial [Lactobacillus sp.]|nr:hypothetical protein [Lactobacillus sp.]